jgi:hypothetical protein
MGRRQRQRREGFFALVFPPQPRLDVQPQPPMAQYNAFAHSDNRIHVAALTTNVWTNDSTRFLQAAGACASGSAVARDTGRTS